MSSTWGNRDTSWMWSDDDPRGMTDAWLARYAPQPRQGRPWVTLTFAQSQDGKIAGAQKQQLRLSGERSMTMTHRIRSMHDAILVGIGTMMADNPRLNGPSPRPIVLDRDLRTPPTCRLMDVARVSPPILMACPPSEPDALHGWRKRKEALEEAGFLVECVDMEGTQLSWSSILQRLAALHLSSVMIEGGAGVIDSVLQTHTVSPMIDVVLVTVAPTVVGEEGYGYTTSLFDMPAWHEASRCSLSPDTVIALLPL